MLWYFCGAALLLIAAKWWLGQPVYHRLGRREDLDKFLDSFLRLFMVGSVVFIEQREAGVFVQFAKNRTAGRDSLEYGFPKAPWSSEHFGAVAKALENAGFHPTTANTGESPVEAFLEIQDIEEVAEAARIVWVTLDAMGITEDQTTWVWFRGATDREAVRKDRQRQLEDKRRLG